MKILICGNLSIIDQRLYMEKFSKSRKYTRIKMVIWEMRAISISKFDILMYFNLIKFQSYVLKKKQNNFWLIKSSIGWQYQLGKSCWEVVEMLLI